jgi:hypothetical protein
MASERRRLDIAARIIALIGLAVCVVLVVAILWARAWVDERVDGTFDTVDGAFDRATVVVNVAAGRLQERASDLDTFIADTSSLGSGANLPPALAERASSIATRFGEIRDELSNVRARIDSTLQAIENVSRFLPFVEVPSAPAEALAAFDERVASIDAAVSDLRSGVGATVERARVAATAVKGAIEGISGVTQRIQGGLDEVRAKAVAANQAIDGYVWFVTIILLILVAYIALLNILVLLLTRRRKPAAPVEAPPTAATTEAS